MLQCQKFTSKRRTIKHALNNSSKIEPEIPMLCYHFQKADMFQQMNSNFDALLCWNELLAKLAPFDAGFNFIYCKRSMIYKECKLFKESLNNIMLAESFNTKDDFTEHKQFCQLAIQEQNQTECVDEKKYFELSYAANPMMPFTIDCLKFKHSDIYGNHIITDQDLKQGDIICIENLFFGTMSNNADGYNTLIENNTCYQRCHHCFKFNNMDLIPCMRCTNAMFCSIICRDESFKIYHKYECFINTKIADVENILRKMRSFFVTLYLYNGNINEMKTTFGARGPRVQTVFDYNLGNPKSPNYYRNLMSIFYSCKSSPKCKSVPIIDRIFNCHPDLAVIWKGNETFIVELLCRLVDNLREHGQVMLQWPANTTQIIAKSSEKSNIVSRKIIGVGYYPFVGLFNHSCFPNVNRHINQNNQMVLAVCRPIKKGEQLFDDYK